MSYIYRCDKCNKNYTFWNGVGFVYPQQYRDALIALKNGNFGKEWQELYNNYPDGAIDITNHVFYCSKCHDWYQDMALDFYIRENNESKEKDSVPWSVANPAHDIGIKLFVPWNKDVDGFKFLKRYPHECRKCGNKRTRRLTLDPCGFNARASSLSGIDLKCDCGGSIKKTDNEICID